MPRARAPTLSLTINSMQESSDWGLTSATPPPTQTEETDRTEARVHCVKAHGKMTACHADMLVKIRQAASETAIRAVFALK